MYGGALTPRAIRFSRSAEVVIEASAIAARAGSECGDSNSGHLAGDTRPPQQASKITCNRQQSYRQRRFQPRVTHQGPALIAAPRLAPPTSLSQCAVCGHENRWSNPFDRLAPRRRNSRKKHGPAKRPNFYVFR